MSRRLWIVVCCVVFASPPLLAQDWPRFRGPNGEGISNLKGLPTSWDESDFEWAIETPGKSTSSPVVWGERVFITGGETNGVRSLYCLDGNTGKTLWRDDTRLGLHVLHEKNSYTASTPAVDGERVYAAYADESHCLLKAFTLTGDLVWTRDFGGVKHQHGMGMSPVVYQDLVIFMNDQENESATFALDRKTGDIRWTQPRPSSMSSYSAPAIHPIDGRDQLIMISKSVGLSGTDPLTGRQLWASGPLPLRTVASPMFGGGMLFASCGESGRGVSMIAVRPQSPARVVERAGNVPYVPTPLVVGQYLYLWNDDGIICCIDLQGDFTQNVWRERVGGTYSGSPVIADGKMYCIAEDGMVAVVDASPKFKNYGKSPLGELSYSTPAVGNGRMYLRGVRKLVSLKAR